MKTSASLIGSVIGGYRIEAVIGQGGMGVVYSARDLAADRMVALKLMAPELAANEAFRERFIRESKAVVDHPNVIPVYETGVAEDALFIAMYLVDGPDLNVVIQRDGRLSPSRAVSIFDQAAAALDAAHENGLVHRDVKPQNILVEPQPDDSGRERVFLTDFGLVKRVSSQSSFTTSAYLMGSVQYMAPEQIEGKPLDGRADVYGLGCVIYEALTGAVPFEKESEVAVLWAHIRDDPPRLSEKWPVLPTGADDIIAKAMAKEPGDRFLTCGDLVSALALQLGISSARRRLIAAGPLSGSGKRLRPMRSRRVATPTPRRPARRGLTFAAGVLATLLGLGMFAEITTGEDGIGSGAVSQIIEEVVPGVADDQPIEDPSDESSTSAGEPRSRRRILNVAASPGPLRPPQSTDDGSTGKREQNPDLHQDTDRGAAVATPKLADTQIIFVDWSGDQTGWGDLWVMNADGSNLQRLTNTPGIEDADPEFSPDKEQIAFVSNRDGNFDIYVMDSDGTNVRRLTSTPQHCDFGPNWSPDGEWIYYMDSCDLSVAQNQEIWRVRPDGTDRQNFSNSPGYQGYPDISPDGKKLLYTGPNGLYTMSMDGTHRRWIPATNGDDYGAVWCPNGKIYFSSFVANLVTDMFRINPDGTGRKRLTDTPGRDQWPTCSPDGRKVAFRSAREGHDQIYVMNADGTNQRNVNPTPNEVGDPSWQPFF